MVLDYLASYGWMILIIVAVGAVLWSMGVFSPSVKKAALQFSVVRVIDHEVYAPEGNTQKISLSLASNVWDYELLSVNVEGHEVPVHKVISHRNPVKIDLNVPVVATGNYSLHLIFKLKRIGTGAPRVDSGIITGRVTVEKEEWWSDAWSFRRRIDITETSGEDLEDYQVKIVLDPSNFDSWDHINPDCSDIRVIGRDHATVLPIWIEECNPGTRIVLWTKTSLPAGSTVTVYLYYGNPSASPVSSKDAVFRHMEVKKINVPSQSYAGQWFSFSFDYPFDTRPVVIAEPDLTFNGSQELRWRLRNITGTGFDIRQQEPSNRDDKHTTETVSYLAVPEGEWRFLESDIRISAGRFSTDRWLKGDGGASGELWNSVSFAHGFSSAPVVFSQVQDYTYTALCHTRIRNVSAAGFETSPEPQGSVTSTPTTTVEVGWVAVEIHSGSLDGSTKSEAGTRGGVDEVWEIVSFSQTYTDPVVVAWMETYNGSDSSGIRGDSLSSTGVTFKVEEDTTYDSETGHVNETVGFFVVDGGGKFYLRRYSSSEPSVSVWSEEER